MEVWIRDDQGALLAVYALGKLRVSPGVHRDAVLLACTKLFQEAMALGAQQMSYSGGYRYWEQAAAEAGVD